jgi:hypothetical protein
LRSFVQPTLAGRDNPHFKPGLPRNDSLSNANPRGASRSVVDDVGILGGDVRIEASSPHHGDTRSGKVRLGMRPAE